MPYRPQGMPLAARSLNAGMRGVVGKPFVGGGLPGWPVRDNAIFDLQFNRGQRDMRVAIGGRDPASYMGENELIQWIAGGTSTFPRFTWDQTTHELLGMLVEEQRTNVCKYSADISQAVWNTTTDTSHSTNTAVSPEGTTTGDTLTATAGNGVRQQAVTTTAIAWTFSAYIMRKTGTGNIDITMDGTTFVTQTINTTTWTRCVVTQTGGASTSNPGFRIATNGDEIYVWGMQAEAGAFVTSFIRTTSATQVRGGDIATIPNPLASYLANYPGLTLYADFVAVDGIQQAPLAFVNSVDFTNITLRKSTGNVLAAVYTGFTTITGATTVAAGRARVALSVDRNLLLSSANGISQGSSVATMTSTAMNLLAIGQQFAGSYLNSVIKRATVWPFAMTAAQLNTLTSGDYFGPL